MTSNKKPLSLTTRPPLSQGSSLRQFLKTPAGNSVASSELRNISKSIHANAIDNSKETQLLKESFNTRLRTAICIDFTKSTSTLVHVFKERSKEVIKTLLEIGYTVDTLPVAFSWLNSWWNIPSANALSWNIWDLAWWEGISNVTNSRREPPIVEGMLEIKKRGFFSDKETDLNIAIIIPDGGFIEDKWYAEAIWYLQQKRALVITILEYADDSIIRTYQQSIGELLWERGTIIAWSNDPISLIRDFIKYAAISSTSLEWGIRKDKQQIGKIDLNKLALFLKKNGHSQLLLTQWWKDTLLLK